MKAETIRKAVKSGCGFGGGSTSGMYNERMCYVRTKCKYCQRFKKVACFIFRITEIIN